MNRKEKILKALKECAHKMFPKGEGHAYLFGSRAVGDAREDSDWDILVVTDDSGSEEENFEKYAFPYAEIGWHFGVQITPIHYTSSEWEKESNTAFYQNVKSCLITL